MTEPLYEHGNFADLIGYRLTAGARRSGGGRRIYFSTSEVRDRDGRLVATGSATYRYRGDA